MNNLPNEVDHLVLNFFAPDCPPCIQEIPELEKFYREVSSQRVDVHFLGIASTLDSIQKDLDSEENGYSFLVVPISKFRVENGLKYRVYLANARVLKSFRVTGFPETMIFKKREGKFHLIRKYVSVVTSEDIKKYTDDPLKRPYDYENNNYN